MGAKVLLNPLYGKLERTLIVRTVVVAMSGGVDSSVAAKLLSEKVRHVQNPPCAFAHNSPKGL